MPAGNGKTLSIVAHTTAVNRVMRRSDSLRGTIEEAADREVDPLRILPVISSSTPVPDNPLGVKGAGEAGIVGAPAAVANAVGDALPALCQRAAHPSAAARRVSELADPAR